MNVAAFLHSDAGGVHGSLALRHIREAKAKAVDCMKIKNGSGNAAGWGARPLEIRAVFTSYSKLLGRRAAAGEVASCTIVTGPPAAYSPTTTAEVRDPRTGGLKGPARSGRGRAGAYGGGSA